jgi:hypothetical protein
MGYFLPTIFFIASHTFLTSFYIAKLLISHVLLPYTSLMLYRFFFFQIFLCFPKFYSASLLSFSSNSREDNQASFWNNLSSWYMIEYLRSGIGLSCGPCLHGQQNRRELANICAPSRIKCVISVFKGSKTMHVLLNTGRPLISSFVLDLVYFALRLSSDDKFLKVELFLKKCSRLQFCPVDFN